MNGFPVSGHILSANLQISTNLKVLSESFRRFLEQFQRVERFDTKTELCIWIDYLKYGRFIVVLQIKTKTNGNFLNARDLSPIPPIPSFATKIKIEKDWELIVGTWSLPITIPNLYYFI